MEFSTKALLVKSLEEKYAKKVKSNNYINQLLQSCKSWGGPVTSVRELQQVLASKPESHYHIVRTELAYYRHTHVVEYRSNPDLFRLQGAGVNHEVGLASFCLVLADNGGTSSAAVT